MHSLNDLDVYDDIRPYQPDVIQRATMPSSLNTNTAQSLTSCIKLFCWWGKPMRAKQHLLTHWSINTINHIFDVNFEDKFRFKFIIPAGNQEADKPRYDLLNSSRLGIPHSIFSYHHRRSWRRQKSRWASWLLAMLRKLMRSYWR